MSACSTGAGPGAGFWRLDRAAPGAAMVAGEGPTVAVRGAVAVAGEGPTGACCSGPGRPVTAGPGDLVKTGPVVMGLPGLGLDETGAGVLVARPPDVLVT
jgi:hypothetical protein